MQHAIRVQLGRPRRKLSTVYIPVRDGSCLLLGLGVQNTLRGWRKQKGRRVSNNSSEELPWTRQLHLGNSTRYIETLSV